MAWTCTYNLRVVLDPCAQYCPCEASEQKMGQKPTAKLKEIKLIPKIKKRVIHGFWAQNDFGGLNQKSAYYVICEIHIYIDSESFRQIH